MTTRKFSQLLSQKMSSTNLSIKEFAVLAGLKVEQVMAYQEGTVLPGYDTCYRLSEVITTHSGQRFVMQDLWKAVKDDRLRMEPGQESPTDRR